MKNVLLALSLLFLTRSGFSAESILTCAHISYPATVIADLNSGEVRVIDNVNLNTLAHLVDLRVRSSGGKLQFLNSTDSDLPEVVFEVQLNSRGFGTGTSYDDRAGGTSRYKCVLT